MYCTLHERNRRVPKLGKQTRILVVSVSVKRQIGTNRGMPLEKTRSVRPYPDVEIRDRRPSVHPFWIPKCSPPLAPGPTSTSAQQWSLASAAVQVLRAPSSGSQRQRRSLTTEASAFLTGKRLKTHTTFRSHCQHAGLEFSHSGHTRWWWSSGERDRSDDNDVGKQ